MKLLPVILILIIFFFIGHGIILFFKPININETIVTIKSGETALSIAQKLYDKKIVRNKNWFYLFVKLTGVSKDLQYGKYLFFGKYSLIEVVEKIKTGEIYLKKITIPEGLTVKKTCRRLSYLGMGDYSKFMSFANDSTFAKKMTGFSISSLEGFLYPETYHFPEDISEEYILKHLVRRFFIQTAGLDFKPNENIDFYDTIILASIVEKEAHYNDEKPIIASVYLNRIEYGLKLQADPTIGYILEKSNQSRDKIYYRDLLIESPYNTYKYQGLTPTPICSPSANSIEAVLNPIDSDYFFFFANSNSRRHIFSQTYSQHLSKQRELKRSNVR